MVRNNPPPPPSPLVPPYSLADSPTLLMLLCAGEWDPSVCDIGVSRLFNYYVEGLWWSVTQPPYINGIYYDGA